MDTYSFARFWTAVMVSESVEEESTDHGVTERT